jgi:hypothetical protein
MKENHGFGLSQAEIRILKKGASVTEETRTYSIKEYILFKLDRNISIVGLIAIAIVSMFLGDISEIASKIASACVGGLCVYIGGRGGNK